MKNKTIYISSIIHFVSVTYLYILFIFLEWIWSDDRKVIKNNFC